MPNSGRETACDESSLGGHTLAKHHTAYHPNTRDVNPAQCEFQQISIEYARHHILDDHTNSEPGHEPAASEQQQVGYPQPEQQRRADEAELNCDLERLIVRLIGRGGGCPLALAG